jgi:cytidylate kinase
MLPKLIVIEGTNASGKSSLGVELAARFGGEIVSADSRQVFRRLDLGSGKITPEEMKGVLAVFFSKTLEDDVGEAFSKNMIANLPPNIQYIDDKSMMDPVAAHQMEQMRLTLDESMLQLNQAVQQNQELQKQLDAANLSLMENREQRVLDWNKFVVQEQDKMALETAKLQQSGQVDDAKLQLESAKLIQQAETDQIKEMRENDKMLFDMQNKVDQARTEGEQSGYEKGVNDGVDAAFRG